MENDVLVQVVNHFEVGFIDGAYHLFDVQAYLAKHQNLMVNSKICSTEFQHLRKI